jgi:serine/threonine protein kinase
MLNLCNRAELDFEFVREIGQDGQNSRTYLSKDPQLNAEIVIKQVEKARLASSTSFFEESRSLYASAHQNVVQILYACYDNNHIYLAMPHYRRGSIKNSLAAQFMTVREIITAGCQVLSGLHNIHSKGLIHFDVKPDNILISDRGESLLGDFGLAKQMNFSGIAEQDMHYTKMMPPEALRGGDQFDRTFDIYQFGLTLYRMCNGNNAFYAQFNSFGTGPNFDRMAFRDAIRRGQFPNRRSFPAHIPQRLRTVVARCLEVAPADRYQSAIDVANDLADIEDSTLDWLFTDSAARRSWRKNESGTLWEFYANADESTECFKTVGTGQRRRFGQGCKGRMTERDIRTFLSNH